MLPFGSQQKKSCKTFLLTCFLDLVAKVNSTFNSVELHSFQSVNGSLGLVGSTASPFDSFAASHLQPTNGTPTVHAGRPSTHGRLCFVGGLLLGPIENGSDLHILAWGSHLSARPVKSIASAEVLASGTAIDEGKLIANVYEILLQTEVHLRVIVDSKDLFTSLSRAALQKINQSGRMYNFLVTTLKQNA